MKNNSISILINIVLFGFLLFLNLYSTLAQSPGNVSADLKLWLKADAGVSGSSPITAWNDQSGNGYVATVPSSGPDLVSSYVNFNPSIQFDGTADYLSIVNGLFGTSTYSDAFIFIVNRTNTVSNNFVFYENLSGGKRFGAHLPWSDGNLYYDFGACCGSSRIATSWGGTTGAFHFWTMGSSSNTLTPSGTRKSLYRDGLLIVSNDQNDSGTGVNAPFNIGSNGTGNFHHGDISEIIMYTGVPTPLELEKIQTYLAIKYGMRKNSSDNTSTVGQDERDYFASDGSVIWDFSANAGYQTELAGIGRDDVSLLSQPKSKSLQANSRVTMDKGGAFPNDKDFVFWATNNAVNGTNKTDVPPSYIKRLNRIWKTTVSGNPGAVDLTIDLEQLGLPLNLNDTMYVLLIDNDTEFSTGANIHTDGASLDGNVLSFTGVTFTDSSFFTVAMKGGIYTGPIGIDRNIKLWLKADAGVTGVTPVSAWADQSGNSANVTVADNGPDLLDDYVNFNPVLDFTSANSEYMQITDGLLGSSSHSDMWVYYVANFDGIQNNTVFNENMANNEYLANLNPWNNSNIYYQLGNSSTGGGGGRLNGGWGGTLGQFNSWTLGISSDIATPNGTRKAIYRRGALVLANDNYDNSAIGDNQPFYIGGRWTGANNNFMDGQLAELIIYEGVPSILEQEQIQSYFSIKYGFQKVSADNNSTPDQDERDYFASDGSVIWDFSANVGYRTELTAIGRDDVSLLSQPKSKSLEANSRVTMDKGGAFPNDKDFIFWATNDAVNGTNKTDVPPFYIKRLNRIWKTTVSGNPGAVDLTIDLEQLGLPLNLNDSMYVLLIDNDTEFGSGATIHSDGVNLDGNIISFTGVTFADSNFFTVALKGGAYSGPVGIDRNIKLWLKADAGVSGTAPVSSWADQSGNGYTAIVPTNGPDLLEDQINFNKVLDFTQANSEYLQITGGLLDVSSHSDMWVYYVANFDANQSTVFNENLAADERFASLNAWNGLVYYFLGNNVNGGNGVPFGTTNIWTLGTSTETATPNGTRKAIYRDGVALLSNNNNDLTLTGTGSDFYIGGRWTGANNNYMGGQLAELIIYEGVPTILEQEKIQTYLAIKYGVRKNSANNASTADQDERDYFASDGSVIWDFSANAGYRTELTAIGRDDVSLLSQPKSKSLEANSRVTMDKGGAFPNDKDFIFWATNDAVNGTNKTDVPPFYIKRLNRIWKTTVSGNPGAVDLTIDLEKLGLPLNLNDSMYVLLIDNDTEFGSGATIHSDGVNLDGNIISFTGVTFADSNFFTVALKGGAYSGPVGIDRNIKLWLKADAGVSGTAPVSGWTDQSGNGYTAIVPTNGPDLLEDQINFNKVLDFTQANSEYLQITGGLLDVSSHSDMWVYYVANFDANQSTVFNENLAADERFASLNAWNGLVYYFLGNNVNGGNGVPFGTTNIWTLGTSTETATPNGTRKAIYRDGVALLSNNNNDLTLTGTGSDFYIGGRWTGANNNYMGGQLAELIIYEGVPTILEQEKIQTYLAIKYGVRKNSANNASTADQDERDYFASDGSVIWDFSANAGYRTELTAIGRDDVSQLSQPKSKNLAANSRVTMDKGGAFPNDKDFIFWATNDAVNGTDNANVPAPYIKRLNRIWKTTVSGSPGAVDLTIDMEQLGLPLNLANNEYVLLIDTDTDFSSGATVHTAGANLSGNILSFTGVTFADSNFFTVAISGGSYTGPVGIARNIKLWLKADAGVSGTAPVSGWTDQSGNDFNVTVSANGPDLLTDQINFNPALDFNYLNSEYMQITNGILGSSAYSDMWIYYVGRFDVSRVNTVFNESLAGGEQMQALNANNNNVQFRFGNTNINGNWTSTLGQYNSWVMGSSTGNATPSGARKTIYKDGAAIVLNNNNDLSLIGNNQPFYIGGRWDGANTYYMDGQLAEFIIYEGVPSILEQEQIQSYFAIKYGFQKASADNTSSVGQDERDYFASDGSVIWDYSANTGYTTEVTAIGRDDVSQLSQPKSKNLAANSRVTMDKGGAFPNDKDFIFWATNDAVNGTDNANVPAPYIKRLNRIWKTTVSGSPGAVDLTIDMEQLGLPLNLANNEYVLLIDTDTDFSSGATVHTAGANLSGNILSFTGVTFADSNFFTVAISGGSYTGPVGIARNIKLWLKADAGVSGTAPVSGWTDQSGNDFNVTVSANGPDLLTDQINFNPALDFNYLNSEYMQITNGILGSSAYSDMWIYYVGRFDVSRVNTVFNESLAGGEQMQALNANNNNVQFRFGNTNINGNWTSTLGQYNSWVMGSSTGNATPSGARKTIYKDGAAIVLNNNNDLSLIGNNQPFYIGGRWDGANTYYMDGQLAEFIIYEGVPSILEQEQIQSYFAIKYGFQKASADNTSSVGQDERDYFASDGSVIWDFSANAGYSTEVTAIGRDDVSQLSQLKSKNIAAGSDITMDKGSSFPNDLDFIFWATNNAIKGTTPNVPAPYAKRLKRIWKTTVKGSPGTVDISIDLDQLGFSTNLLSSQYALLIDTDTDFSSGATVHTTGSSLSGGVLTFSGVTFSDGNYFTVAAHSSSFNGPGNVDFGLQLWLKADTGITGTSPVSGWNDLSGNGFNATVPGNGPDLLENQLNSNPTIDFTASNFESMRVTGGILGSDTYNDMWIYVVSKTDLNLPQTMFYEGLSGGEYFDALIPWNNQNIYFDLGNTGAGRLNGHWGANFGEFNYWTLGTSTLTSTPNGTRKTIYKNGLAVLSNNNIDNGTGNNQNFILGAGYTNGSGTSYNFDGQIAELIIYSTVPSIQEQERIQSYLSLKYGIPKENIDHVATIEDERDYFASDGSVIWDYSDSTDYNNDIIGVIRDDNSRLLQKQSSSKDGFINLFIDTLATSNSANTGTISNDVSSILVGHNAGILQGKTSLSKPTDVYSRFERVWKITNTNFSDTFSLEIEWDSAGSFDINDIVLLIDTNDNFSNARIISTADGLSFTLGSIIVSGIDTSHMPMGSTRFVTIGSMSPSTPLPIELLSFTAKVQPNRFIQLEWKSASEINNDYFTVERSADLIHWYTISKVESAGNSSETVSYSTEDIHPLNGIAYYRLKQTDIDGKFTYSSIASITIEDLEKSKVILFPNPARDRLTVKGNPFELISIKIYNVLGVEITANIEVIEKADSEITLSLSNLPAGVYVLRTKTLINTFVKE